MDFANDVRLHIFETAAATGTIPQPPAIAQSLHRSEEDVRVALKQLATARIIVLAPGDASIWIAAPFCAVPSRFHVDVDGKLYNGICIWDALGIIAILGKRHGSVRTSCGDCGEPLHLGVADGRLTRNEGIIHFGVPARNWWDNIGFT